jgi:hypothetical protein
MKRLAGIRHYRSESTMEHTEAIETNASDRYALGQLSAAEADAFEEHYFDCADCAEDVRLGMTIMEGGRRLVREAEEPVEAPLAPVVPIDSRPRWGKWIPAAAAAALMAIPINIALLMRMQSAAPQVVQVAAPPDPAKALVTAQFLELAPRGVSPLITADTMYFNVDTEPRYENYEVQVLDTAGKVVSKEQYPSKVVEEQPLSVDTRVLRPGNYQLVIFGTEPAGQSTRITRTGFIVKRTKRGQLQQRGPRRGRWNSHTTQAPVPQAA